MKTLDWLIIVGSCLLAGSVDTSAQEVLGESKERRSLTPVVAPGPSALAAPAVIGAPYRVRLVYMIPSNRRPQLDAEKHIQRFALTTQNVYRENLARSGYGDRTFEFETEPGSSVPKVHVLRVSEPDTSFRSFFSVLSGVSQAGFPVLVHGDALLVIAEIQQQLPDASFLENSVFFLGLGELDNTGVAVVTGETLARMPAAFLVDDRPYSGLTIPAVGPFPLVDLVTFPFFEGRTISSTASSAQGGAAHELGHAFGLPHEFLNDDNFNGNMMGNGLRGFRGFVHPRRYPADDVRISGPSARQLLTNRFFNAGKVYTDNVQPTVEILSDGVVAPEKGLLNVRFKAADDHSELATAVLLRNGNAVGELLLTGRATETTISTYSYDVGVTERWEVLVYDAQGNRMISGAAMLTPAASVNHAPIPFIKIDRRRITAGESVTVDASGSYDPDGQSSPLHVEWDLNGDTTFDTPSSTRLKRTVTFAEPGTYQVVARLTDGAGDSSISTRMGVRVDPRVVNSLVGFEQAPSTTQFVPDATGCPSGYAGNSRSAPSCAIRASSAFRICDSRSARSPTAICCRQAIGCLQNRTSSRCPASKARTCSPARRSMCH